SCNTVLSMSARLCDRPLHQRIDRVSRALRQCRRPLCLDAAGAAERVLDQLVDGGEHQLHSFDQVSVHAAYSSSQRSTCTCASSSVIPRMTISLAISNVGQSSVVTNGN